MLRLGNIVVVSVFNVKEEVFKLDVTEILVKLVWISVEPDISDEFDISFNAPSVKN